MVQGLFEKTTEVADSISCSLKKNQKKQFRKNKKDYPRLADHIGQYPLVMITPNDVGIILEGSEERRKFIDNVISQTDNRYLDTLIQYNRIIQQRNQLLKMAAASRQLDLSLLDVLDSQLIEVGDQIFAKRKAFMQEFAPFFKQHYNYISGEAEMVELSYESPLLHNTFAQLLATNQDKDRILERTSQGIHKDDLLFSIHEGMPLKKFGSQGQQKSFLIALKLAQYSFLKEKKGYAPLLLLDDIFDKLDDIRTRKIMQMVSDDAFGQIFITDTDAKRISQIFQEIGKPIRIFEVKEGAANEKI